MNTQVKRELIRVRNAVRRKLQALREGAIEQDLLLRKSYEPLTEPLEELAKGFRSVQDSIKTEPKREELEPEFKITPPKKKESDLPPIPEESVQDVDGTLEVSTILPVQACDEEQCYQYTREQIREMANHPTFRAFLEDYDELPRYYVEGIITDTENAFDNPNGIKYDLIQNKFFIDGDIEMQIDGKDIIIDNTRYSGTPGLYELLLKKEPTGYKQSDLKVYGEIMEKAAPNNPQRYIQNLISDTKGIFDTQYGVRYNADTNGYYVGDSEVTFGVKDLVVKQKRYKITPGLLELLFKKEPVGYTEVDLQKYKDIVYRTNAHKSGYKSTGHTAGNKGKKYQLVKKLMSTTFGSSSPITSTPVRAPLGRGLLMEVSEKPIEYVYFDNPNELCERLKLLVASQEAGNTGHTNEIASIVEELRECGIIL